MIKTLLITNDPRIAQDAQKAGVARIMVDLEAIGKKERQASRTTFISTHTKDDIAPVRNVLTSAELVVRVNPWHGDSKQEVEEALARGADFIMLPMITALQQFQACLDTIRGRAKLLPLIETKYSMEHLDAMAASEGIDELYIGLNDLHLDLGMHFLFEPLADGLLDAMAEIILARGKAYGFGGIAMIGTGELPAEYILAEHARLKSSRVILSSRFCKDIEIGKAQGREQRLRDALQDFEKRYRQLLERTPAQEQKDFEQTRDIIRALAARVRVT